MGSKFESILKKVAGRKRLLNAVNAARRLLTASLILTGAYLIICAFGMLPKLGLIWLLLSNLFAGAVGFVIGYFRRTDLASALYQADRKLGLGEKLCTIYDLLSQAPTSDFLPMLYQRIARIEIDIKGVFPFSRAEKIKLTSLVALALLWALLALQYTGRVDFVGLQDKRIAAPAQQKSEERESPKMLAHSEELAQLIEQLAGIQRSVEALEHLRQEAAASEAHKEALEQAAQQLTEQLDAIQRSLLGQEPSTSETAEEGAKQSQKLERVKQDLQRLDEKISQGAPKEEISELLESIAQNMDDASFKKELSEAAQAQDSNRLKELSERISKQLEEMAELSRQIEELQKRLKEQLARGEQGESGEAPDIQTPTDQPGLQSRGEEAAVEPNTQGGKSGTPMPKQPSPSTPDFYKAQIRGLFPEAPTNIKELPTKRAPVETQTTAQGVIYRVDYQKLEAFLGELRDELSPEMLEIIRAYFQKIAQQER